MCSFNLMLRKIKSTLVLHLQAERAHALANETLENGIPLSTNVFNSLLSCVGFLKEGTALRIDALKALLMQMKDQVVH